MFLALCPLSVAPVPPSVPLCWRILCFPILFFFLSSSSSSCRADWRTLSPCPVPQVKSVRDLKSPALESLMTSGNKTPLQCSWVSNACALPPFLVSLSHRQSQRLCIPVWVVYFGCMCVHAQRFTTFCIVGLPSDMPSPAKFSSQFNSRRCER